VLERVIRFLRWGQRPRIPWTLFVGLAVGFVAIIGANLRPPDPESRLPAAYRLTALIERQQQQNDQQRREVEGLRNEVDRQQDQSLSRQAGLTNLRSSLIEAEVVAGTVPVRGVGFSVSIDDSTLEEAPSGNVNDLVIHSQDVQAVVNAMWSAGAEAIAINDQRLVSTSAILCVGNTLLLNGTVHSPPYVVAGVGVNRSQFLDDKLVRTLKNDVERFSLRFSTSREETLEIPAYSGSVQPRYARAVTQ